MKYTFHYVSRIYEDVEVEADTLEEAGNLALEELTMDGEPELYGQNVTLELGDLIRPERKFESAEALTAQIRKDQEAARAWFGGK